MITYQPIRARYEMAVRDALAGLSPGIVLYYDNVQEEPLPGGSVVEYATITVSFPSTAIADLCGSMQRILGNVQVNIYGRRMNGMKRLEEAAAAVACALMSIHEYPEPENVVTFVQSIAGPNPVLSGNDPLALTVVSAPFTARLESD
jgi:hypothetical protein